MKKVLLFLLMFLFTSNVYALDLGIESVTVLDSSNTSLSSVTTSDFVISPKMTFSNINDSITLKVLFNGNDIDKYTIDSIEKVSNPYIDILYKYDKSLRSPLYITMVYARKTNDNTKIGDIDTKIVLLGDENTYEELSVTNNKSTDKENDEAIYNPKTGFAFIIGAITLIPISFVLLLHYFKNINGITLILLFFCVVILPIGVLALSKTNFSITINTDNISIINTKASSSNSSSSSSSSSSSNSSSSSSSGSNSSSSSGSGSSSSGSSSSEPSVPIVNDISGSRYNTANVGNNKSGQIMGGHIYFNQHDYSDVNFCGYNSNYPVARTVATSGCGLVSLVMCANYLNGNKYTPEASAKWFCNNGHPGAAVPMDYFNNGSSFINYFNMSSKRLFIHSSYYNPDYIPSEGQALLDSVKSGHAVILHIPNHYVALTDSTSCKKNEVFLYDSSSYNAVKCYTLSMLHVATRDHSKECDTGGDDCGWYAAVEFSKKS